MSISTSFISSTSYLELVRDQSYPVLGGFVYKTPKRIKRFAHQKVFCVGREEKHEQF